MFCDYWIELDDDFGVYEYCRVKGKKTMCTGQEDCCWCGKYKNTEVIK